MICIYHSRDLDGWMSAAIVKKWWHSQAIDNFTINYGTTLKTSPSNILVMLGWDYGDKIPDLSGYEKVIMVDIAFPKKEMLNIGNKLAGNFIWIDHHISAINDSKSKYNGLYGLRDIEFAACELTWKYFFLDEEMPEVVRLLGRYDCFEYKGMDEEQKVLKFQYGARSCMSNYNDCYRILGNSIAIEKNGQNAVTPILDAGKSIYNYLCTEAKQIYAKAFPVIFKVIKSHRIVGIAHYSYKFLCVNQERFNPINFGIDYHKDGYDGFACFWYKDGKWIFSLYNDNGKVDCSVIAKHYGGGGHFSAAGMVLNTEEMLSLIQK